MTTTRSTLFDEVTARLPLFDELPRDAPERLAASGLGRGLITASVRTRLRKAGFVDMGTLAIATPCELAAVRKIGPVRVRAIRSHVLDELARIYPDARAVHDEAAMAGERLARLKAIPADHLALDKDVLALLGCTDGSCAGLASKTRWDLVRTLGVPSADLDRVVVTLANLLLQDQPRVSLVRETPDDGSASDTAGGYEERARILDERDREWDDAAPATSRRNG